MQRVFQLPRLLIKKATVSGRRFRKETMRSVNYEEKHSHQALSYHLFVISTRTFSHSDHRRLAVYVFTNRSLLSPASPPQSGTDAGPCSPERNNATSRTPAGPPGPAWSKTGQSSFSAALHPGEQLSQVATDSALSFRIISFS